MSQNLIKALCLLLLLKIPIVSAIEDNTYEDEIEIITQAASSATKPAYNLTDQMNLKFDLGNMNVTMYLLKFQRELNEILGANILKEPQGNLEEYNRVRNHGNDEPAHSSEDRSVADALAKEVRVLCWVMTHPGNHKTRAVHVKATWGKRCNKLIFMSTKKDSSLPAVKLPIIEGRNYSWAKTKAAFRYVYEHHRREADWFMKADDDTYVIVENLRYMLSEHKSTDPIYFGCRFKGFMSGGAGYVLSRAALDLFVNKGLPSPHLCKSDNRGAEDVEMAICLHRVGVKAVDSRDSLQKIRFLPVMPQELMMPHKDKTFWYWSYENYPTEPGIGCCSDYTISFHHVTPADMYAFEFLIYRVRAFGIRHGNAPIPRLISQTTHKNDVREKSSETPERILLTVEDGMKSSTMTLGDIARRLDDQGFELPTEKNIKEETTESSTQEEVTE